MRLRERSEAFIFKGNRVLADASSGNYITFPGGGIDKDETPIEAAKRECMEETARRLINLTPAHPPTVQIWPEDFAKSNKWAKDFAGGYSYWFTGSSSEEPESKKHKDYQPGFKWMPIEDAIEKLRQSGSSAWKDDVQVRIKILETHLAAMKPKKTASGDLLELLPAIQPGEAAFPVLHTDA